MKSTSSSAIVVPVPFSGVSLRQAYGQSGGDRITRKWEAGVAFGWLGGARHEAPGRMPPPAGGGRVGGMSVLDNPLVVLAVVVVGVVAWWRLTRKAPWSGPGELSNLRGEQQRYQEARDRIDRDEDAPPPR
jgi:hypothetical protein